MPTIMKNGVLTHLSVEDYNKELALYRKNVLNIDNNTGKLSNYNIEDLGKIWINGQEFTGMAYQGFLTTNTKTYVEEPTRANDGSIPNINEYDTFVVPRCKVNFKYLTIDDYQRLCEAIQSNEFVVKYYDKQFNKFVIHKMYCEPEEMSKLYNVGTDVFGVLDYEVSFIGTRNDLQEFSVKYIDNGGAINGNPQLYAPEKTYKKGDKVKLEDNRYFEAIFFENTFKGVSPFVEPLNTKYWENHNLYEYNDTLTYKYKDIVYSKIVDSNGKVVGRNYFIAIYKNGDFSSRPLTDSKYWKKINVKVYDNEITYSSNKTKVGDDTLGQFVVNNDGTKVTEAIFYNESFVGKDPTDIIYWQQLAIGVGINVLWGNSLVVDDPEKLFSFSGKHSYQWNTKADGSGFTYYPTQSINVFKDITLYAIWE